VILGTGVGGGVVVRGRVWPGAQGIAGEWGHHAVFHGTGPTCYCGRRGCVEQFASGPAVERSYRERTGCSVGLRDLVERRHGDPDAAACIEGLLEAFGRGIANVIDILDPSAVVLGGGVSNVDLLYREGVERVAHYVFNDELRTPILRHALGDSAGVIGAALLSAGSAE
jgi:fructokinase